MFVLFVLILLELLGIGLIVPVLAPLFLRPDSAFFAAHTGESERRILYALLLSSYSIAQFFGAPLLGSLSDRFGRKPLLLSSSLASVIGYGLFFLAVIDHNLLFAFASRIFAGFFAGNITLIYPAIADRSTDRTKARNFGFVGMAFGFAFVVGPIVGGLTSNPEYVSWFGYHVPFLLSAIVCLVGLFLVLLGFRDVERHVQESPSHAFWTLKQARNAWGGTTNRTLFVVVFLTTFGFAFFTQFFQVFLIKSFDYTQTDIGRIFGFLSLWIVVTQGIVLRSLSKRYSLSSIFVVSTLGLSVSLVLLLAPSKASYLYLVIPFVAISQSLAFPALNAIVSNRQQTGAQGEVLGLNQSMQALAQAIPPIIAALASDIQAGAPLVLASCFTALALVLFFPKRNQVEKN